MSTKLVSSLGYRFKRVVKCFHEVWLDSLYRVYLVISNSEFLDNDKKDLIKFHTRALLVYNRKCNPDFWTTCLPYVLRKQKNGNYYMDYVILVKVDPINFAENGIDVKADCEKTLESVCFDDVCLLTDGDSTRSEDLFFFSIWVFYHDHSRITGPQGKGEGISLTPHYHFHPLHRHLDISRVITAESSPLHVASSRSRTGNLRAQVANH